MMKTISTTKLKMSDVGARLRPAPTENNPARFLWLHLLLFAVGALLLNASTVTAQAIALNTPGALCVNVDREQLRSAPLPDAQLLILDRSGSMGENTQMGVSRIEVARDVLIQYAYDLPKDAVIGFRAYGFGNSCTGTELLYPVSELDAGELVDIIDAVSYPEGDTPIAYTLSQVSGDFRRVDGTKEVLLVTDGQESCGGDPIAVAADLAASDADLTIHVVGFDIDDAVAQANLRGIPRVARGNYVEVSTERDLLQALSLVARLPFEIFDTRGAFVAEGLANRSAIELDSGVYYVSIPELDIEEEAVEVQNGRGTALNVDDTGKIDVVLNDPLCIAAFCPDVPLPRLVVGEGGRVTYGDTRRVRVRAQPDLDAAELTRLDLGEEFEVLDGPICNDGYLWWRVRNGRAEGWSAEGVTGNYYLEPWN